MPYFTCKVFTNLIKKKKFKNRSAETDYQKKALSLELEVSEYTRQNELFLV